MKNKILYFTIFFNISYSQQIIGDGLSGQPLLDYIVNNYKTSTTLGYNNARDILYSVIDLKDGDQLSCVYSGYTITLDTELDPSTNAYNQGINCEHTWPQSMGASEEPQKSDLHHLFPCKDNVNSSRGNDPYGQIDDEDTDTWYRNDYSQNCQIKLVGDLIQSEHLLVQRSGDSVEIENLSGETFVNGEPISSLTSFRIEII